MPKIEFRTKVQAPKYSDGSPAGRYVKVPTITTIHCDMAEFRKCRAFSEYANSDLFPGIVRRALAKHGVGDKIDLLAPLPECVKVDESGFLALVTIEVSDWR